MIENEFKEIEKIGWNKTYLSIKEKADVEAKEKKFTTIEAKSVTNRKLNRYGDVNPYDHSRIVLKRGDVDYINANLVQMDRAQRKYILCQGPLPGTVSHFWLMAWEQNSKAILMLNKLIEKKQIKCHAYWPDKIGAHNKLEMEDVGLSVEYLKSEEYQNYSKRTFKLTDTENNESREILQFHYTTWPDFGIPSSPYAFLCFLKRVKDSGALDPDVGPPIIHCSAGIGRSGTFCLVDCCLVLVEQEGESNVSVQSVLLELRKYRMGLIQTVDQLYFSYQAILEGLKRINDKTFDELVDEEQIIQNIKQESDEEITPPLPPPRINSLNNKNIHQSIRPLPSLPQKSSGLIEEPLTGDDNNSEKERINNLINNEKKIESNNMNRPLPPLPKLSLAKLDEKEHSSDIDNDDDDSDDDDEDEIEETYSDDEQQWEATDEKLDDQTSSPSSPLSLNGEVISPVSSPDSDRSRNTELRQRKRIENQKALADKVREIKRKQRETEEKSSKQSKKRRSLIISLAAGAFISALCIYLYAKFN